ncbi:MAG: beta-lactamase family protein [Deltaproteobacteria bacterium]|nr:beta-lactamase family protein [Deltaproteobacteria bacterium]MBI4796225.1 beta-lactamase family protein [Deltaproteobacteria bacterium]
MSYNPPDPWSPLDNLLEEGRRQGVYTAAVAVVGLNGELQWEGATGRVSRDPEAAAVNADTVFDLASLTKPLATALALMRLAARGQMTLETTLGEVLQEEWLPRDKRVLTIRSLLAHQAGLPAWRPFYETILAAPQPDRAGLAARLAGAEPLEYPPGPRTLYSDLGYMLLQAVVEAVGGCDLDSFCRREIYRPLGLPLLGFCPRRQPGGESLIYAATEEGLIPGRGVSGEVHDENAWAAGGVAGHAGIFGAAGEVFQLLSALYRTYQGDAVGPLVPEMVRVFLTPVPGGGRTPGFDTASGNWSQRSASRFFSPRSIGHLGFTGVSFWLDPDTGQMVVLLTNRVHLGREDKAGIQAFRPRFHEAASRALGFNKPF